jgi:hypothetical protein
MQEERAQVSKCVRFDNRSDHGALSIAGRSLCGGNCNENCLLPGTRRAILFSSRRLKMPRANKILPPRCVQAHVCVFVRACLISRKRVRL